jgi:hypothetical protein
MPEAKTDGYLWDIENPEGYANVMGRYRTRKELAFLLGHVVGERLRILDVGGGSGRHAVPLAERGHDVTSSTFLKTPFGSSGGGASLPFLRCAPTSLRTRSTGHSTSSWGSNPSFTSPRFRSRSCSPEFIPCCGLAGVSCLRN